MPRIKQLKTLLNKDRKDLFILFALAKEYEKIDKPLVALAYYDQILSYNPKDLPTYLNQGILYDSIKEQSLAQQCFLKGLKIAKSKNDFQYIPLFLNRITT